MPLASYSWVLQFSRRKELPVVSRATRARPQYDSTRRTFAGTSRKWKRKLVPWVILADFCLHIQPLFRSLIHVLRVVVVRCSPKTAFLFPVMGCQVQVLDLVLGTFS